MVEIRLQPACQQVHVRERRAHTHDLHTVEKHLSINRSSKGSFTLSKDESESNFFLRSLSLLNVNIKFDSVCTHLEAMAPSLLLQYKQTLEVHFY